jgi:hypothetical protein
MKLAGRILFSVLVFLIWIFPAGREIFVGTMPYLMRVGFGVRCLAGLGVAVSVGALWYYTRANPELEFEKFKAATSKSQLETLLGFPVAALMAAVFAPTLMGSLVEGSAAKPYGEKFKVLSISLVTKGKDGARLALCDSRGQYELFLDEDNFDYASIFSGDLVGLEGRESIFGVLVDHIERVGDGAMFTCQPNLPKE